MQKNIILGALLVVSASFIQSSTEETTSKLGAILQQKPTNFTIISAQPPVKKMHADDDDDYYEDFQTSHLSPSNSQIPTGISPIIAAYPASRNIAAHTDVAIQCDIQAEQQADTAWQNASLQVITAVQRQQAEQRHDINVEKENAVFDLLRKNKRGLVTARTQQNARIKAIKQEEALPERLLQGLRFRGQK